MSFFIVRDFFSFVLFAECPVGPRSAQFPTATCHGHNRAIGVGLPASFGVAIGAFMPVPVLARSDVALVLQHASRALGAGRFPPVVQAEPPGPSPSPAAVVAAPQMRWRRYVDTYRLLRSP